MTTRLSHFAINTEDVEGTQQFYGSVFGWSFRDYGQPGFVQILADDGEGGEAEVLGSIQQRRQLLPDAPTLGFECTFGVDDVDAVQDRVTAAGGKILMDKSTIPGVGHLLAFQDPGGNPCLVMEYDKAASMTS